MDYAVYLNELGGMCGEAEFYRFAPRAAAYLDTITSNRASSAQWVDDKRVQLATAAVIDAMVQQEQRGSGGVVSSASNDGVSVSYDTSKSVSAQTELHRAASLYLMSTGLLYRGLSHVGVY